jgi:cytochrome P450
MPKKSRLQRIANEPNPLAQNRLLFRSLRHDARRAALYRELQRAGFPALRFKSVLRTGGGAAWPSQDVYLLSARQDIALALQQGSVKPYAELDSGGRFMLGVDDQTLHDEQRDAAKNALDFKSADIERCVQEALARSMVLAERLGEFDLVKDVAEQAALRLMSLLFGMPAKAYYALELGMVATYMRLTFQIIGRHFVENDGLPPPDSRQAAELKDKVEQVALDAAQERDFPEFWDEGFEKVGNASLELAASYPNDPEMRKIVILGLIAGTVGNVASAVANTIDFFFRAKCTGELLIDRASRAARRDDNRAELDALVDRAITWRPPAPFLTRVTREAMKVTGIDAELPAGTTLLLAMGADVPCELSLAFGGALDDSSYAHSCIGRHLALPLVRETVRQVLRLPGLARVIDPATGRPKPLVKQWGAACLSFPLRYARARRMNQQPLFLSLKIKEPVGENALILKELTRVGAPVVERALAEANNVHFAWFGLIEGDTRLFMYTVYDGDFDAYVEHFAMKVPLFNEQFRFLEGAPPTPVRDYPREFVEFLRKNNNAPLGGYFYSAYPGAGVADIQNAGLGQT